ncbi:MAG: ATP-binding cassette domain-containing protein [Pseudomonadota bacterium]|nr:ATP-binding cassette domain-containing protein [Pseudomonadota bacterium]
MPKACISATGLSVAFEPNPPVFHSLDLHLPDETVALIGPNGVGKTLLGECLAGVRRPNAGQVQHHVPVACLSQHAAELLTPGTVADFLGVEAALAALDRLLSGNGHVDDLSTLDERWTLKEDLIEELTRFDLPADCLKLPMSSLSGGQRTRLHLLKLSRIRDVFLILDEPSNHLDQAGRCWLSKWLSTRPGGALVITHDQTLLQSFGRLLELRDGALQWHGQGFAAYLQTREQMLEKARHDQQHTRQTIKRELQQQQTEKERHEQRIKKGRAKASKKDMPKILLDARKERSEATGGRIARKHQSVLREEQRRKADAESVLGREITLGFPLTEPEPISGHLLQLDKVILPWVSSPLPLDVQIRSGERWWLRGNNGSGKSTLLQAISGDVEPRAGQIHRRGSVLKLDQHLSLLHDDESALENFRRLNPGWTEGQYRDRLALVRLPGNQALNPVTQLSGGERLKVALACTLMGPTAAQLVLLDEPDNHLDLESQILLAQVLRCYQGTLLVVTHSEVFAEELGLDKILNL